MKVVVVGSTDVEYSTAWHYAVAFEYLGHDVERREEAYARNVAEIDIEGVTASVHVGRLAGLSTMSVTSTTHVFSDDGVWVAQCQPLNTDSLPTIHYLRSACHGPEAHESEAYPPWEPLWDVAFVGSSPGHPEWPHRAELVAHLHDWYGPRFIHVGPGGSQVEDDSKLLWGYPDRPLRGHWLNRFYRSVPIIIGDTVMHDPKAPFWTDRVYETWARGGFLLHPGNDLLAEEVGNYPGFAWQPGDWTTLHSTIDMWLADPEARKWSCAFRQEQMRIKHTYTHRATELLDTLGMT